MIHRISFRLQSLGFSQAAVNHIIASFMSRGALGELECIINNPLRVAVKH